MLQMCPSMDDCRLRPPPHDLPPPHIWGSWGWLWDVEDDIDVIILAGRSAREFVRAQEEQSQTQNVTVAARSHVTSPRRARPIRGCVWPCEEHDDECL
jgi:hypothetical protein